jgi:FtsZ-interacting cell division protein YlmF
MSEYQYYEFRAIERPLSNKQVGELRRYSSRADITATSFSVEYDWGDFKGDPHQWMEKYFDAFVHVANWGTRWFMVRIPAHVLAREVASEYYADDFLEFDINGGNLILSFRSEEDGDWADDESWMASLIALRADLMKGDHRCLYLGWLRSIQGAVYEGDVQEDDVEPPVPAGLRTLSQPLECFANFLGIDFDLLAAAAEQSQDESQLRISSSEILAWVRSMPETEKDSLLARIIEDDVSHPEVAVRQRAFSELQAKYRATVDSAPRRTPAEILVRAEAITKDRQRIKRDAAERERVRRQQEQAEQRRKHLESLRGRETDLWTQAKRLIVTTRPRNYDEATSILQDLRELAEKDGASSAFHERMQSLCRNHANKPALLERFQKAKLALQR